MADRRVDLAALAVALGDALRRDAGIPVTPERCARFARALSLAPPRSRRRLYFTARAVFVSGREQLPRFDRVFAAVFDGIDDPADVRGDPGAPGTQGARAGPRPAGAPGAELGDSLAGGLVGFGAALREPPADARDDAPARELPAVAASAQERLADRDFAALDAGELRALRRLMRALALAPPPRRTRRLRRDPHGGRLDVRATVRASRRTGGDPARPVRRTRIIAPRRLVLLCDISGSMEPYARAYLQLLHAAVGGAGAEAFVFATRLTRLTRALRGGQPDLAIERAAAAARDWSSGTRLGASLQRFNDDHGRRGMARGAVIVIISDGWERGDPALVEREMQRLRRLAHRIVWVNPRRAAPGFSPLAAGMAAALPFCDEFVSGHNLRALSEVAAAIAGADGKDRPGPAS